MVKTDFLSYADMKRQSKDTAYLCDFKNRLKQISAKILNKAAKHG